MYTRNRKISRSCAALSTDKIDLTDDAELTSSPEAVNIKMVSEQIQRNLRNLATKQSEST